MRKTRLLLLLFSLTLTILLLMVWLSRTYNFSLAFPLSYLPHSEIDWPFVFLNVLIFSLFALFTRFRGKVQRLPSSVYLAFIIALYVEMYGFPLTMYAITWLFRIGNPGSLWYLLSSVVGHETFVSVLWFVMVPVSNMIIVFGILLVILGWRRVYRSEERLVTTGVYGYVRHPQYLGFLLITLGMNVLWITFSTLFLWPILVFLYYRLAKDEDKTLRAKFGEKYQKYAGETPMFIPRLL